MPHTATLTVAASALRRDDEFVGTGGARFVGRTLVQRGKDKGKVRIEHTLTKGAPGLATVCTPDTAYVVQREVPTAEERDTYRDAYARFTAVVTLVEARTEVVRAAKAVREAANKVLAEVAPDRYSTVLGRAAGDLERTVARFAVLCEVHMQTARDLAVGLAEIEVWATSRSVLGDHTDVLIDGKPCPSLYSLMPAEPRNIDCYLNGHPAVHPTAGNRYAIAPLTPEENA